VVDTTLQPSSNEVRHSRNFSSGPTGAGAGRPSRNHLGLDMGLDSPKSGCSDGMSSSPPLSPTSDAYLLSPTNGGRSRRTGSGTSVEAEAIETRRRSMRATAFANDIVEVQDFADVLNKQNELPFVDQMPWVSFVSADAVLNLLALGLEADYTCYSNCEDAENLKWVALDLIFTLLGVFEVVIVLMSLGPQQYFCGDVLTKGQKAHLLRCTDLFLVLSRVLHLLLYAGGVDTGIKLLSMFRIIHLASLVKRLAPLRGFRELWLILQGLGEATRAVAFVVTLLVLLLWVFGTAMTIIWGKIPKEEFNYSNSMFDKDDYWSTVPKSMFTLFEVFTKDRWAEVIARPLVMKQWGMALFFALFLVITVMSLSTTLVGVVVESSLSSAQANEEKNGQEKQKFDAMVMNSLEQAFTESNEDHNGDFTKQELHKALEKGSVRSRLKLVDISVGDLDLLYTLLDEEGLGFIKTTSFFRSCTRLRGDAMARHSSQYMTDLVRHTRRCERMETDLQIANNSLGSVLDHLHALDKDVIKTEMDVKDPVIQARRHRSTDSMASFLRHNPDSRQDNFKHYKKKDRRKQGDRNDSHPKHSDPPWGAFVPEPPPIPDYLAIRIQQERDAVEEEDLDE